MAPHKVFALENVARALPTDWRNFLWEVVAKGKCLVTVNLSNNEAIEGATLEPFAEAAAGTLEVLCLKNCPGFEGSLEPLRSCRKLKQLFLAGCVQLEGTVEPLAALPGLLRVDLECCFGLTGDLAPLCGLKELEVLNVCDTNLEGATTVAAFQAAKEGVACAVGRYGNEETPLWRAANCGHVRTTQMLLVLFHAGQGVS